MANLVAASPKHTFDALTEEMVKAKEPWLLAEAQTEAEGRFTVRLD